MSKTNIYDNEKCRWVLSSSHTCVKKNTCKKQGELKEKQENNQKGIDICSCFIHAERKYVKKYYVYFQTNPAPAFMSNQ